MDAWLWALLVEYVVIGLIAIYVLVDRLYRRAALRRLAVAVLTQHPIANTSPPTSLVHRDGFLWIEPISQVSAPKSDEI